MAEAHEVVGHDDWVAARTALLAEEKELTRRRDELSLRRRELPWEAVDKEYVFEGPEGERTLAELFDGRSQLLVYHFMFPPEDDEGCIERWWMRSRATLAIWKPPRIVRCGTTSRRAGCSSSLMRLR
jgi:predicted dithiol-disulfide oxidoreductase (DUF899 family)